MIAVRSRIVDADDLAISRHQRATGVAGIDRRVVLDHRIDRGPVGLAIGARLGDDAAGQGELRIAQRVAGSVDVQSGAHGAAKPFEVRIASALDVNHRHVGAFRHAEDLGIARFAFAAHPDFEQCGAGHDVVVGHGVSFLVDDETGTPAGGVILDALLGIDKRPLRFDLDYRLLQVVQRGNRHGNRLRRGGRGGRVRGNRRVGGLGSSRLGRGCLGHCRGHGSIDIRGRLLAATTGQQGKQQRKTGQHFHST